MKDKKSDNSRKIDEAIKKTAQELGSKFSLISKMEIKTWKAYLTLFFVVGFAVALIFSVRTNIQIKSFAEDNYNLADFKANLPKDPDGKEQKFEVFSTDSDIVYYSQRKIDSAIVEKDQAVYVFEKASGKLKEKKISYRSGLPQHLPANLVSKEQAEASVDGKSKHSALYYASPESDIFNIDFDRSKPIWAVTSFDSNDYAILTIVDATTGKKLGNGVPPPSGAFSMTGPTSYGSTCSGSWSSWSNNAASWFGKMGYVTDNLTWPLKAQEMKEIQNPDITLFYELAHGSSVVYVNSCTEYTYGSDIKSWISSYPAKQFAFIGSCDGMCNTGSETLSYELRKGIDTGTAAVGYCGMSSSQCWTTNNCWSYSLNWQDKFFSYMSQGYTVKAAFDKANVDYPICGANKCMRFAGDPNLVLKVNSDSQAPIASITSPMDSEILSGSATVSISASDNIGVVRVELYKDGALFATDTSLPYQFIWDTTKDVDGSYKIQAKAYDAAGNIGTSSEVNVIVYNNSRPMDEISPIVSISSPANGAVTTKTTKINASGSDNVGIVSMLAFLDEIQVCSGTSSVLSCNIVNKKYSKGFHQITIQAADAAGNKGFSVTSVTFQ